MSSKETFVEACIADRARPDDIDDWIEGWHAGDGAEHELHEHLGMSDNEFTWYLRDSSSLPYIIAGRKDGILAS